MFTFLALIVFASVSFAQFKLGISGGFSSSKIKPKEELLSVSSAQELYFNTKESKTGYHIGGVMQLSTESIFIQPELLFTSMGGSIEMKEDGRTQTLEQQVNRMDIPVVMGIKMGPLRIGAGPVVSYVFKTESLFDEMKNSTAQEKLSEANFGYQAGVGVDFWRIGIDLKYEGSLTDLSDGMTFGGTKYDFETRTSQWILSLNYYLIK